MADSLISLGALLIRAVLPVLIIVGVIGNSLNIAVLIRPAFYPHACSRYLLATAVNNVFFSSVVLVYQLLVTGYQLEPGNISVIICKFMVYFFHLSLYISPYNIVLASIERYFASSTNVHLRRFSSIRVSRWAIGLVIGFLALFMTNTFILTTTRPGDGLGCQIPGDTIYNQIYVIVQVLLYAIIAPCLMTLFGFLTVRNLRQVRIAPVVVSIHRRKESQLIRMLLLQVVVLVVLNFPLNVTYLTAILPVSFKSSSIFYFINAIGQILTYASFSIGFIAYIIGTRSYRKELMLILNKFFCIAHRTGNQRSTNTNVIRLTASVANRQNNNIEGTFTH